MPRRRRELSSAFAGDLAGYVRYKRGELNCEATKDQALASAFDRSCAEDRPGSRTLGVELALAWVSGAAGPTAAAHRASFARGFARYLLLSGKEACILPGKATPIRRARPVPHVFTEAELSAFFAVADSIGRDPQAGFRHLIAPTVFRLMCCTGPRPHEARTLPTGHFGLESGVIHVAGSKGRCRDVPVKRGVADMCAEYSATIESALPRRPAFFPNADGSGCWSRGCMGKAFRICRERAGAFADPQPVPYSSRHTFAAECIRRWKAQGVDIAGSLCVPQAYMGHEQAESTLYYVRLVRGGAGDPAPYGTWEPINRMEGHHG